MKNTIIVYFKQYLPGVKFGNLWQYIFVLIVFITTSELSARSITFNYLSSDNGLSQFTVYSLYNDENGLIWIGTRNGLNIYDGFGIKVLKHQQADNNSLKGNVVERITGNRRGLIYVLTNEGINSYNVYTSRFSMIASEDKYPGIDGMWCTGDDLYFSSENVVYKLSAHKQTIEPFFKMDKKAHIASLLLDKAGNLWIGSTENNGLIKLSMQKKKPQQILTGVYVRNLYEDSSGNIWACTWEDGVYCIGQQGITNYRANSVSPNGSISDNSVRDCCEDDQGNIWIGTFLGLDKLDRKTNTFTRYAYSEEAGSLSNSSVYSIIKDHQGSMWVGTYFGGVNYFNPDYEIFTHYKSSSVESEGLSFPVVGAFAEDKNHTIWIATEGGGVNSFNPKTGKFKWYRHTSGKNCISQNNIKTLYYDKRRDVLWIGVHQGGLNRLDIATGRITLYDFQVVDNHPANTILHIAGYQNRLLLATHSGVFFFDPETGKFEHLLDISSNFVFVDSRGILWIASEEMGLYTYNLTTKKLKHYLKNAGKITDLSSISDNNISYIAEDRHHNIWLATANSGIDLYNPVQDTFENFNSANNGLVSDCVYAISESQNGQMLVATNQGFSIFDYFNKYFRNYDSSKGFPFTTLNENSLFQASDGLIYLGGIRGMVSFDEKNLNIIPKPYSIIPHRLLVNGKEVKVGDKSAVLSYSLLGTKSITLKSSHSVFSFEFTTTNYIPSNKDELFYRLEGFSNEWINTHGQHTITYTNLPAGDYVLVIRANGINKPYQPEYRLKITVMPPFYKSIWAYIVYVVLITSLLYYLIKTYKSWFRMQESLKYEQQHIKDVEELNQSKLRFFTNISHEFRTPLTIIIGQIEMLLQLQIFTPSVYNRVLNIYKNSFQLKELINELLDFRKQEMGHMKIRVSNQNVVEFLYENYLLYVQYAATRRIKFDFEKEVDEIMLWYDSRQMQKVINNLLSNAFKFTPEGGQITMLVKQVDENVIIQVKDSGIGLSANDINQIFNRFYQVDSNPISEGTGIGLALSKGIVELHHGTIEAAGTPGEGAIFTITLRTGNSHFSAEDIESDDAAENSIHLIEPTLPVEYNPCDNASIERIRGTRMLIVEDNKDMREMLSSIFESYYEVNLATNGEEGLSMARELMPDIILSDIVMPRMTGTELCRQIKTDFETCHIPVVLLTSRTAVEHKLEGLHIGADDYITKPFNVNLLVLRCNNLVNSRLVLHEKYSKLPQAKVQMLANNPMDKDLLDRTVAIIERNLDNSELSLNDLIRELYISRTTFFQKIKSITGQSPSDFIQNYRLKKAAYLLRTDFTKNISEIADITGFSSPRFFGRCFKEVYHISPLLYRKEILDSQGHDEA